MQECKFWQEKKVGNFEGFFLSSFSFLHSIVNVVYELSLPNAKLLQVAVEILAVLKGISSRDQVNVLITSEGFLLHIPDLTWALKTFFQESTPFLTKKGKMMPLYRKKDINTYVKALIKRFTTL